MSFHPYTLKEIKKIYPDLDDESARAVMKMHNMLLEERVEEAEKEKAERSKEQELNPQEPLPKWEPKYTRPFAFKTHQAYEKDYARFSEGNTDIFRKSMMAYGYNPDDDYMGAVKNALLWDGFCMFNYMNNHAEERADLFMWMIENQLDLRPIAEKIARGGKRGFLARTLDKYAREYRPIAEAELLETGGMKTMTGDVFMESIEDDRIPILTPILSTRESAAVWAKTGIGKTWFTLTMALAAAGGENFAGVQGHGVKVFYIDGEMAANDLKERMKLIVERQGWNKERVSRNLELYMRTEQDANTALDMRNATHRKWVIDRAKALDAKMLVLDNLSTLWMTDNENDAAAFNSMNTFITECRGQNLGVLIVDHANKIGTDMRGSSNKKTVLNVCCGLKPVPHPQNKASFTLVFDKWRGEYHEIQDPKTYTFEEFGWVVEDDEAATMTKKVELMYHQLVNGKFRNKGELETASGRKGQSFKNLLGDMKKTHQGRGHSAEREWYTAFFIDAADTGTADGNDGFITDNDPDF